MLLGVYAKHPRTQVILSHIFVSLSLLLSTNISFNMVSTILRNLACHYTEAIKTVDLLPFHQLQLFSIILLMNHSNHCHLISPTAFSPLNCAFRCCISSSPLCSTDNEFSGKFPSQRPHHRGHLNACEQLPKPLLQLASHTLSSATSSFYT